MTIDYTQPPRNIPPPPPPGSYVPPQQQPQKSSGCWKWGAIGCGLALVIVGIVIVGAFMLAFGLIKQTFVYKDAVHRAETNPQVIAALGTPIGTGWLVSGSVHTEKNSGTADVRIPIEGPKGKANIHCVATMTDNNWKYDTLVVEPEHGPPIDLLH
jgi:cytochrome oxidase complex assembly protein 1